jgi:hypothetical protein
VILPGFTLERREDGPFLQLARLALIVAVLSRCGGPRGRLARRRRRGPEGLRAAGGAQARNVSPKDPPGDRRELRRTRISAHLARRYPGAAASLGPGALRAPLKTLEIFITGSRRHPGSPGTDPRPFQDHDVSPRMVKGRSIERPAHRVA